MKTLEGMKGFREPTHIHDLMSFLGAINQLSQYMPDLSQHCVDLRGLLSKDSAWVWTPAHRVCFDKIKAILAEPMGLKPFNTDWKTELFIDFSPIGLGIALTQYGPKNSTKR